MRITVLELFVECQLTG